MTPVDMTPEKLRFIANYVQECDDLILQFMERAGITMTAEQRAFVSGHAVQDDLREWADSMERTETSRRELREASKHVGNLKAHGYRNPDPDDYEVRGEG